MNKKECIKNYIYVIEIKGYLYIGRTKRDPYIRMNEHIKRDKKNKLGKALKLNPTEFNFKVIDIVYSTKDAKIAEQTLISKYDTCKNGLNSRNEIRLDKYQKIWLELFN